MLDGFTYKPLEPGAPADGRESDGREAGLVRPELLERFIAKLIDALIVGAFFAFPSFVGVLAGALYILISDGLFGGASIGKRIIGLRVVVVNNGNAPCEIRRSLARNAEFGVLILLYVILGWVPYLGKLLVGLAAVVLVAAEIGVIITDEEGGARLGDRVAETMVVVDDDQT